MLEFDLKKRIPSMYDLKASFNKMFSICSPGEKYFNFQNC